MTFIDTLWPKVWAICAICTLLVASSCGSVINDKSLDKARPSHPVITVGLRYGDYKPHQWGRKKPTDYPVHGVDVSKYQGRIDWRQVKQAGIDFAFIKATEGGDRRDERFEENWQATKAVGLPRGAYHFYYFCRSAEEQAAWFINTVPREADSLPPVLDMEWNHLSPSCKRRPPPEIIRQEMRIFLARLEQYYHKRPIIYTTVDFFDQNGLAEFKHHPFWLRSVAGHPDEKYGPHPWVFWQYTGTGAIPGITAPSDINAFSGKASAWEKWRNR